MECRDGQDCIGCSSSTRLGMGVGFLGWTIKACSCQTLLDEISTLMLANPTSNILTNEVMRNVIYVHCTMYVVHDVKFVNEAEVQGQTRHFKQVQ